MKFSIKFIFFLFSSYCAFGAPNISYYCDQIEGKVLGISEWNFYELDSQSCYKMMCESERPLKILGSREGEDVSFHRADERTVEFLVCQDGQKEYSHKDLKVNFSYVHFDLSLGKIETFFLKESEPCFKQCSPSDKNSSDYDCKHCMRKNYYPKLTDVSFLLSTYFKASECMSYYTKEKCSEQRTPAEIVGPNVFVIEDVIEEMWCEITENAKEVSCKGRGYVKGEEKLKEYFIQVPFTVPTEFAYKDSDFSEKTDIQLICLNTGKTPFDLNYQYISCSDGVVYKLKDETSRASQAPQNFDGARLPAGKSE